MQFTIFGLIFLVSVAMVVSPSESGAGEENPTVLMETSLGSITIELDQAKAPITLAMARTNVVDSATAQFFINVVDNDFLDHQNTTSQGFGYAVFGKVIQGMDVVEKIKAVKTGSKMGFSDVPAEAVVIKSVKRGP